MRYFRLSIYADHLLFRVFHFTNNDRFVGVVNDVIADTAQESSPQGVVTAPSDYYQIHVLPVRSFYDGLSGFRTVQLKDLTSQLKKKK